MIDLIFHLFQWSQFRTILAVIEVLFAITVIETIYCTAIAMKFNIRELSGYRKCFFACYNISTQRNNVTWQESRNNWILWLSVITGNCHFSYLPLLDNKSAENIGIFVINASRFMILFLLTPFHIAFTIASIFERFFRFLLGFTGFVMFWILANLKVVLSYNLNAYVLEIKSDYTNSICTVDVLYRKPTIKIMLCRPGECPDSAQKDNINHFIASLKSILPRQKQIKFKTIVCYPGGEGGLQTDLPLTEKYLSVAFKKITVYSKEANL